MKPLWLTTCIAAAVIAGCVSDSSPSAEPSYDKTSEAPFLSATSSQNSTVLAAPNGASRASLEGTKCHGGGTRFSGPIGVYQQDLPEEWRPRPDQGITFINHFFSTCERVSWAPHERGPIGLMWEVHQGFTPPRTCFEQNRIIYILATSWFSDSAIVEQAKSFGMPAWRGNVDLAIDDAGALDVHTWTWQAEGAKPSSLQFQGVKQEQSLPSNWDYRFFWFDNGGVSYIDLDMTTSIDHDGIPLVIGSIEEPNFYASFGPTAYAGTGTIEWDVTFSGKIYRFSDLLCEHPLS